MPFSFKPAISPNGNGSEGSPLSFGGTSDLMARAKEGGASLIQIALYIVFGIACVLSLVLFGYRYYLNSNIEKAQAEMTAKEQELSKFNIQEMSSLSSRIKIVGQLIKEHPYANAAFRIIENSIENPIVYKSFNLTSDKNSYTLVIQAQSPDYKSIAQQVDTLKSLPYASYITEVKVGGLSPDEKGRIGFSLEMPIVVTGTLPEDLDFSRGASDRIASSTERGVAPTASSTQATSTSATQPASAPR